MINTPVRTDPPATKPEPSMTSTLKSTKDIVNRILKRWDHALQPDWESQWWRWDGRFHVDGQEYRMFCHNDNCGWPPARMTERSVELAIADRWLEAHADDVCEIGAVTPYYWPRRVKHVVDPFDEHPLVSHRESLFDLSLVNRKVLSISTIEHIGIEEYGQAADPNLTTLALKKLFSESPTFLVTAPLGYNHVLDRYLFEQHANFRDVRTSFVARGPQDNHWAQVDASAAARARTGHAAIRIRGVSPTRS